MAVKRRHFHRWRPFGTSSVKVEEKCNCGARRDRPSTKQERKDYFASNKRMFKEARELHRVWNNFQNAFQTFKRVPYPWNSVKNKGRGCRVADGWKYTGHDFITRVQHYARRYPNDIFIHTIDDAMHSGSRVVFFLHRRRGEFFGTTVLVIPQNSGPPCEFFMYPSHLNNMLPTLHRIRKLGGHARW